MEKKKILLLGLPQSGKSSFMRALLTQINHDKQEFGKTKLFVVNNLEKEKFNADIKSMSKGVSLIATAYIYSVTVEFRNKEGLLPIYKPMPKFPQFEIIDTRGGMTRSAIAVGRDHYTELQILLKEEVMSVGSEFDGAVIVISAEKLYEGLIENQEVDTLKDFVGLINMMCKIKFEHAKPTLIVLTHKDKLAQEKIDSLSALVNELSADMQGSSVIERSEIGTNGGIIQCHFVNALDLRCDEGAKCALAFKNICDLINERSVI